jgi:hypothetical protein
MYLCRKRFKLLKEIALEIQKNFKGYLARAHHLKNIKGLSNDMNKEYFHYHALIIQNQ